MVAAVPAPSTHKRLLPAGLAHELAPLLPYFAVAGLYIATVVAIAEYYGLQEQLHFSPYSRVLTIAAGLAGSFGLLGYLIHLRCVVREPRPLKRLAKDAARLCRPQAVIGVVLPLAVLPYFMSAFTSFKGMIPALQPFYLDEAFARLDRALHFGKSPWELTHAVFSGPAATLTINIAYNIWLFLMLGFLLCHMVRMTDRSHRARYLLTFVLCWSVLGSLGATLLSSAGPCYYGRVIGSEDIFAPLMTLLADQDAVFAEAGGYWRIWALSTQEMLWEHYAASTTGVGSGISAMPSMHLALATLMALSAWRIGPRFGWTMTAYAAVIMIGSVHLGWHYAIDGYVSIIATIGLWRLAGWIVERGDSLWRRFPARATEVQAIATAPEPLSLR